MASDTITFGILLAGTALLLGALSYLPALSLGPIVEQYIGATVLSTWGKRHGLVASERLIGGEIASIPAFHGPTGQFDQNTMNAVLAQRHMDFGRVHDDIGDDLIRRQLLTPIITATRAPDGLLRAYAQLVIDRRIGSIGLVPAKPDGIAAPTDQEISEYYKGHIARYSLPERRALRYALIGPETITAPAPSEAEIAAQYKTDAAKYAASETRTTREPPGTNAMLWPSGEKVSALTPEDAFTSVASVLSRRRT